MALLQEELVDKDKLYVVGVPCDGIVDRRKLEKEFADEMVDIAFPEQGKVVVTTRQGRDERICPRTTVLLDVLQPLPLPQPVYADDTAGPAGARARPRATVKPDWSDIADYENLSDDDKQALLEQHLRHLHPLLRLHQRLPGVLLLGQVREPLAPARAGEPEGGAQGEPAVPDGAHVPRGRPLPVVRRL